MPRYSVALAAGATARWLAGRYGAGYMPDLLIFLLGLVTALGALLAAVLGLGALVLKERAGAVLLLSAALAMRLVVAGVRQPDDAALVRRFAAHRADFARLGAALAADGAGRAAGRRALLVPPGYAPLAPPAGSAGPPMPPARLAAYRALFGRLGLPEGAYPATAVVNGGGQALGDATLAPVFLEGFLGKYHQAGYAYAPGAAGPAFDAWVRAHRKDCAPLQFRHLEGDWYEYRYFHCPSVRGGA